MKVSLEQLEEALRLRRQIDALEKRLSSILGRSSARRATREARRRIRTSKKKLADLRPGTRGKISASDWSRLVNAKKKKSTDLPTLNPGSKYRIR
jgi:hypothetical protein